MSSGAIIGIVIAVLVVLAVVVVITTARRSDARSATGYLSRETRQMDKGVSVTIGDKLPVALTGKEVELAAVAARAGTDVVKAVPSSPAPFDSF